MAASMCDVFSFCMGVAGRARVAVEVRFVNSAKGKGLFATQLIRKGETIFVERPLVAAQFLWNALYRYRACDHCLRALEKAEENAQRLTGKPGQVLPHPELCAVRKDLHQNCPHCQVVYCSAECRLAAAEQYHQVLCPGPSQDDPLHPLNKLQEAWRSVHYPPETASIMLMARMVATVKQAKDKDRWIRLFSQFCNKTANEEEEIVHKLLGDKFKGQLELLRRLFTEALYEEALSQQLASFLTVKDLASLCFRAAVTTAVSPMQRPPSQKTTSFCMSLPWRISSQERENYLFVCSCPKCLAEADEPNVTSEEDEEDEDDEEEEGQPEDAELGDEMTDV
ncbi:histone-lysine N-trimethyltransferase SMYD5 isoform X4 [Mirounga angustirostris]|uniref:histone-lysine N-trimethyltransferase SMYD5 isoform X4 n=1 Tax=Mirounga angustirostris TaxID=9716 RepID=UPI00313E7CD1